jgi:hypothetical protein
MHERSQAELRRDIDGAREDLALTVDELVNQRMTLRQQIERHPMAFTASVSAFAALFGLMLGRFLGRRSLAQPRFLIRI